MLSPKDLRSVTAIFLVVVVGGFNFTPFFLFEKAQAAGLQSSVTIITVTVCGNGVVETGEACDDGANNGQYGYCKSDCSGRGPYCGDGTLQSNYEQCDDSNIVSGDGCSSTCQSETPPPTGGGGGGGVAYIPPKKETKVIVQGKAYPSSPITVLEDGRVAVSTIADAQANFKVEITGLTAGIYTFGVWAEDTEGRKSITFSFTTSVTKNTITTIGGIFIPPSIALSKTVLQRGETLNILGQTAPQSEVSVFMSSLEPIVRKTKAEADGTWFHAFDTTPLEQGSHTSRAKAVSPGGLLSTFSNTLAFSIGKVVARVVKQADANNDNKVNLVDFSVLLYNWGIPKNPAADLNSDGKVNIVDFSIMLYYWTG